MLKLAQEHRGLVMDVTEEDADALRGFEQKNNQDLMRLWFFGLGEAEYS